MELKEFMETVYLNNPTQAIRILHDNDFLRKNGWRGVWHESLGYGVASIKENIVAIYDEEELDTYHEYTFYRYNPNAWVNAETDEDWDSIYEGNNGEEYEVEPI